MNALVIGAKAFEEKGGFGKWHIKALAELFVEGKISLEKLFVARTSVQRAEETASYFKSRFPFIPEVVGVKVAGCDDYDIDESVYDLENVVGDADYVSVCSKDAFIGDTVHAVQSAVCLSKGKKVFCEKPLCEPSYDGEEKLKLIGRALASGGYFSMNLPFAVMAGMFPDFLVKKISGGVGVRWVTAGSDPRIIKNLLFHPLSLFHLDAPSVSSACERNGSGAVAVLNNGPVSSLDVVLGYGRPFMGFQAGGSSFVITYDRASAKNVLFESGVPLGELAGMEALPAQMKAVVEAVNPLKTAIRRLIEGQPVVDFKASEIYHGLMFRAYDLLS